MVNILFLCAKNSIFYCLGQPGDLVAAKTELKITQRLRIDQYKLEDLERKLRTSVINALSITGINFTYKYKWSFIEWAQSPNSNRKQCNCTKSNKICDTYCIT